MEEEREKKKKRAGMAESAHHRRDLSCRRPQGTGSGSRLSGLVPFSWVLGGVSPAAEEAGD